MGLLTFGLNVTLDGCIDHTQAIADDELHDYWTQLMDQSGAMLFGRNTYELMEGAWPAVARDEKAPRAMREWARKLEAKAKYVVSSSRNDFPWQNTIKVEGDLREAISALKAKTERGVLVGAPKLSCARGVGAHRRVPHRRSSHHQWPRADVVSWPVECAASRAPIDAAVQVRRAGAPLPSQSGMSVEGLERVRRDAYAKRFAPA